MKDEDDAKKDEDGFDRVVEEIQRSIRESEERVYSEQVLSEVDTPQNFGNIEDPDATGAFTGPCGDTMVFDIKVKDGVIVEIMFRTDGCGPTVACGSMLTRQVQGKDVREVRKMTAQDLEEILGGLPEENKHCSVLAVQTLNITLDILEKGMDLKGKESINISSNMRNNLK